MHHHVWQHLAMLLSLLCVGELGGARAAEQVHFRAWALATDNQPSGTSMRPTSPSALPSSSKPSSSGPAVARSVSTTLPVSEMGAQSGPDAFKALYESLANGSYSDWLKGGLTSWAAWTFLGALAACTCYRHKAVGLDSSIAGTPTEILARGHFNCLSDTETCACSLLCPGVRWADSATMAGAMHFWPAFLLFALMLLLNTLSHAFLNLGFFTVILLTYYRQSLRKKLGMQYCTCSTCVPDALFVLFCPCCAIAQEARSISVAYKEGTLTGIPVKLAYNSEDPDALGKDVSNMFFGEHAASDAMMPPPQQDVGEDPAVRKYPAA
mmetsp:Transcript_23032/g.42429  ORF Transcript_23032/g.42429 Transcript_23032/m.42429 type:complete len:324 (-) Transcript_23032:30-1001(-)